MLNFKYLIGFLSLVVTIQAHAFDMKEYHHSLAKQYIEEKNYDEALKQINEGLELDPSDKVLIELKPKAERSLKKQQQAQAATEQRENAKKDKVQLQLAYCGCILLKKNLQKAIQEENTAATHSGMVNKVTLYNAGQGIHGADTTMARVQRAMKKRGIPHPNCKDPKLITEESPGNCGANTDE